MRTEKSVISLVYHMEPQPGSRTRATVVRSLLSATLTRRIGSGQPARTGSAVVSPHGELLANTSVLNDLV